MVEAPAGTVPPAQTPFVCQATKLIEIKAGSCWPGIIKSLTSTNNDETGRGGVLRPAEMCFGGSDRGWMSLMGTAIV